MAIGNSDGSSADIEVELEAMRKDDFSWHPCEVSLCSAGVGLVIKYLKDDSSEIIVNKGEALERIRVRSIPLEGDDCSLLKQGDHVLATRRRSRETLLFDAEVHKALSVKGSKKIHPRCTFMVKWINHQVGGETITISCNSMRKVSTKSITCHPTICAFFSVLGSSSCFSNSPMITSAEGLDSEFDLTELENQVEKISNLAADVILGNSEQQLLWQGHGQSRKPAYMEVKDPHQKDFSPLPNPIAARAALASMMSKLYWSNEVSPIQKEMKELRSLKASNGNTPYSISAVTNFSKICDDDSLDKKSGKQVHTTIVKELFPDKKAAKQAHDLDSPPALLSKRQKKKSPPEYSEIIPNACLSDKSKSSKYVPMPSNKAKRLTRSAALELGNKSAAKNELPLSSCELDDKQAAETKTTAGHTPAARQGREIVLCLVQSENLVAYSSTTKNQVDERVMCGSDVGQASSKCRDLQVTKNSRRLTRSAVHGTTEKEYGTSCKGLEENRSSGCVKSNLEQNSTAINTKESKEGKVAASIQKLGGDATYSSVGSQGTKRKSTTLKQQELRFSPRLRSLNQSHLLNNS